MRAVIVALMFVLVVTGSARADIIAGGTADPLGLFQIGAVVPFFGSTGNQAYLEIESPVGDNGSTASTNPVHVRFFRADCSASTSVNVPMSANDVAFLTLADGTGGLAPYDGLAVIAGGVGSLSLSGLANPLHARSHWVNVSGDFARTVDPIVIANYEGPLQTWSPLRTGAQFYAPLDDPSVQTSIVFICPSVAITGCLPVGPAPPCSTLVPSLIAGAPPLDYPSPRPVTGADSNAVIRGVVYDDDELSLRDITTTCDCVTIRRVTELEPTVYADPVLAANGTYTELRGGEPGVEPERSFTGYRAIRVLGSLTLDDWGRLHSASADALAGTSPGLR
jgi:hypothetical protein